MKSIIIYIMVIVMYLLVVSPGMAAVKYVDPVYGNDSAGWGSVGMPYATIKFALSQIDSTEYNTIRLFAGRDYHNTKSVASEYGNKWVQILIILPNITIEKYDSGSKPRIVGDDSYMTGDEHLDNVILVHRSGFNLNNVKVDGYDATINPDSVEVHDAVLFSGIGDNSSIVNCEFEHFGQQWEANAFYSIISGWGKYPVSNPLNGLSIQKNLFHNNPFPGQCAHEIYLTKNTNATVYGNRIYNNGKGTTIKLRDYCTTTVIDSNTVHGAYTAFIEDHSESGETNSTGTKVRKNAFADSLDVIPHSTKLYFGPFYQNNMALLPFISEYSGNTFTDATLYADNDSCAFKIYGVACDADTTYLALYHPYEGNGGRTKMHKFRGKNSPLPQWVSGSTSDNHKPNGDMCYTPSYVIVCTINGSNNAIYKFAKDDSGVSTVMSSTAMSSRKVTALAPYTGNYFLSAIKINNGSVKIFKSTESNAEYLELKNCEAAQASEVTALSSNGSEIIFAAKVGSNTKLYSFTEADTSLVLRQTWNTSDVPSMTFFGSTLMTAVKNTGSGITTIYRGSYTDPDYASESIGAVEILQLAGYSVDADFLFAIKNVSSDGDKKLYFTDTSSNLLKDVLYYSRWWRDR